MKLHSVVLCRNVHPNDEYHRRTAVIFGNFLSPTSQRPTLKSYSSEGHPRTRSFSSVPQGYMPCGELLGFLFCLTCFVRAEEVQFEEAPKSPRAIPSVTGTQLLRITNHFPCAFFGACFGAMRPVLASPKWREKHPALPPRF